jgi:dTDP-4-amino-4,6-dideoxygalactose transaminase/lipid II:glycine glycyltransferase (peptidoglycan interpeptide bridge formation enzyme)
MIFSSETKKNPFSNGVNIFNSLGSNYDLATAMRILVSFGGENRRCELNDYLEKRYGGKAVLVYKGRDALTLALEALPEKSLPAGRQGHVAFNGYTCLAVYESIVRSGHMPLYLDIAADSLDFSFETLHSAVEIHPDIKAVVIQNTLGIPCDIAPIAQLCRERGIVLIEDLAHSIGARYENGAEAGTVGDFVVLSFSQDKVVDAVSGGALIVRNEKYRVVLPSEKVSLTQQLKDRLYPRFTWKIRMAYALGIGAPYHAFIRMTGILSSPFGKAYPSRMLPGWYCVNILRQFRVLEKTATHRKAIADVYVSELSKDIQLQFPTERSSNLRFPILVDNRSALVEHLKKNGVHVSDIWYDAPIAPKKYMSRAKYADECPQAEKVSERMLNLPTHINVSPEQAMHIAQLVNRCVQGASKNAHRVEEIKNKDEWENFIQKARPHSFLHSWLWGEHNATTGHVIFRVGVRKGGSLVAAALFIEVQARRGSFLLCPHGPVFAANENETALLKLITQEATRIGQAEQCDFIRFCPLTEDSLKNAEMYRTVGFRNAPIHMHPELSWMLDITKSEDDLMREMRKTTRYLVKKMEKEGVEISVSADPDDIEKFWPIYQATVQRQQFTPFKKDELRKEFELFAKDNNAAFFFGTQGGDIVAAAIIIFYNGQAFYHHSGSLSSGSTPLTTGGSNVSYLLQWRVIQEAKRRGCTLYNFWGISPADRPHHPWAGLSLFKKGFGGFAEKYLHAQDKPLTAKYFLNFVVETARRLRRGF